jgi:hypothetical protein
MHGALTLNEGRENVERRDRKKSHGDGKLGATDVRASSLAHGTHCGEVYFPDLMSGPLRSLKTRTSIDKVLRGASVESFPNSLWLWAASTDYERALAAEYCARRLPPTFPLCLEPVPATLVHIISRS